jgi:hypothetical protein
MANSLRPEPIPKPSKSRRHPSAHTLVLLLAAFALRVAVVGFVLRRFPRGWFFTRGVEMPLLAKSLLTGHGYSSPFGGATGPSALIAPGYPLLTALVFRLFGIETTLSAAVIMSVHILLNLATVWLILALARRLAGERSAVAVALLWACSPPIFEMPVILWETSFSALFMLAAVAWAITLRERIHTAPRALWAAGGAGIALAGLVNPALLPSFLALATWLALRNPRRSLAAPAIACCTFAALFSPWPLRNAHVFHAFIPTRTTVGCELWFGNHPGGRGFLDESMLPFFNPDELRQMKTLGEVGYCDSKSALARSYVRTHLAESAQLTTVRLVRFWSGTGTRNGPRLFLLHATLTTLLGLAGLWLLSRSARQHLTPCFLIPFALFPLPYILTHAEFRYRIVIDPLLCVLASLTLDRLAKANAARRPA